MNFNLIDKEIIDWLSKNDCLNYENLEDLDGKFMGIRLLDLIKLCLKDIDLSYEFFIIWNNIKYFLKILNENLKKLRIKIIIFIDRLNDKQINKKNYYSFNNFIKNFWGLFYYRKYLEENKDSKLDIIFNKEINEYIKSTTIFYKFIENNFLDNFINFFSDNGLEYYFCPNDSIFQLIYCFNENKSIDCIYGGMDLLIFENQIDNFIWGINFSTKNFSFVQMNQIRFNLKFGENKLQKLLLKLNFVILKESRTCFKNFDSNLINFELLKKDNNVFSEILKYYEKFEEFYIIFDEIKNLKEDEYFNTYDINKEEFNFYIKHSTNGYILTEDCNIKNFNKNLTFDSNKIKNKLKKIYIFGFYSIINLRFFEFIFNNVEIN